MPVYHPMTELRQAAGVRAGLAIDSSWPVAEDRSRRARISGDFGSNVRTRLLSAIRRPTAGVS
jgi:hypothetical protein